MTDSSERIQIDTKLLVSNPINNSSASPMKKEKKDIVRDSILEFEIKICNRKTSTTITLLHKQNSINSQSIFPAYPVYPSTKIKDALTEKLKLLETCSFMARSIMNLCKSVLLRKSCIRMV